MTRTTMTGTSRAARSLPSRRVGRFAALAFAATAVVALGACGSDSGSVGTGSNSSSTTAAALALEGPTWQLIATTPLGVDLGTVAVTATFESGTVTGTSGCNTYNGPYKVDGSKLTIGPNLATTQRACGAAETAVETAYLGKIVKVASYKIAGTNLTLSDSSGAALLTYQAAPSGAAALEGAWNVTSFYTGNAISSVSADAKLTAIFTATDVSGSSGCNTYRGASVVDGSSIKIGPLASTKIACANEDLSKQEASFLAAMELATSFKVTGNRLDLLRDGGTIAVTLERA